MSFKIVKYMEMMKALLYILIGKELTPKFTYLVQLGLVSNKKKSEQAIKFLNNRSAYIT